MIFFDDARAALAFVGDGVGDSAGVAPDGPSSPANVAMPVGPSTHKCSPRTFTSHVPNFFILFGVRFFCFGRNKQNPV
jgi:hypothetical protein